MTSNPTLRLTSITAALLLASLAPGVAAAQDLVPQAEESDVATLPPSSPHRVVILEPFGYTGAKIIDGDSGKLEGIFTVPPAGVPALAPNGQRFYVLETFYSKYLRGVRTDQITVYDATTLKIVAEIPLPGRLFMSAVPANFSISADGKRAFVYNMQPASSVIVVDLEKLKVANTVELPGCALSYPWRNLGFSSLCGDGALVNISFDEKGKPKLSRTEPFFDADQDPIFENSLVDPVTGEAVFLSYTGKIYRAKLGQATSVEKPWTLQEAAGQQAPGIGAQDVAWRPGGRQLMAWHRKSGQLYVLMHMGVPWGHKAPGAEIWVADLDARKVVRRIEIPIPAKSIAVSQDDQPLLYVLTETGDLGILDAKTGAVKNLVERFGGQLALVPER